MWNGEEDISVEQEPVKEESIVIADPNVGSLRGKDKTAVKEEHHVLRSFLRVRSAQKACGLTNLLHLHGYTTRVQRRFPVPGLEWLEQETDQKWCQGQARVGLFNLLHYTNSGQEGPWPIGCCLLLYCRCFHQCCFFHIWF